MTRSCISSSCRSRVLANWPTRSWTLWPAAWLTVYGEIVVMKVVVVMERRLPERAGEAPRGWQRRKEGLGERCMTLDGDRNAPLALSQV